MLKYILCLLTTLTLGVSTAAAYEVIPHTVPVPYDILPIEGEATAQKLIIGELRDYPQMIEIVSDKEFMLTVGLRAVPGEVVPQFTGIVVRVLQPRGVEEVTRLKPSTTTWSEAVDPVSKLPYQIGPVYEGVVPAGTYRIEVSTPENAGKYILVLGGQDVQVGYGATWRAVATMYEFYDASKFGMLRTPLVYYPLGIIVLLAGFGYTVYRTRDRLPLLQRHG
jgi:hypothetical protein